MEEVEITVEQLQEYRADALEKIALADAMKRLEASPDFCKVFIEAYAKDTPARLVGLFGDASINYGGQKTAHREDIQERLIGIARFLEYIRNTYSMADQARKQLDYLAEAEAEAKHN